MIAYSASSQIPVLKCAQYNFDENANLFSKTINDIFIDTMDQIWVSSNGRVQYFDGQNFYKPLPHNNLIYYFKEVDSNDYLCFGTTGISLIDYKERIIKPFNQIGKIGNLIGFGMRGSNANLTNLLKNSHVKWPSNKFNGYNYIYQNNCFTLANDSILAYDLVNQKTSHFIIPKNIKALEIMGVDFGRLFYRSINDSIYALDLQNRNIQSIGIPITNNNLLNTFDICKRKDGPYVCSVNEKVYQLNSNFRVINEIRSIHGKVLVKSDLIKQVAVDRYNNIYIGTLKEGLIKVITSNRAIKFYANDQVTSNFSKCVAVDKKRNRILVGTWGNGLQIYDTTTTLVQKITDFEGSQSTPVIIQIVDIKNDQYLLYSQEGNPVYLLTFNDKNEAVVKLTNFKTQKYNFNSHELIINNQESIVSLGGNLLKIKKNPKFEVTTIPINKLVFCTAYINGKLVEGSDNKISINDYQTGKTLESYELPLGLIRTLLKKSDELLLLGTDKGLYEFNIISKKYRKVYLEDMVIYGLIYDDQKTLWVSTNNGLYAIDQNNAIKWLSKVDGLQDLDFNTNCIAKAEDGELFFGGLNGTNSFMPQSLNNNTANEVFIDMVCGKENCYDRKINEGEVLNFPSDDRSLKIKIGVTGFYLPSYYNKQFLIENITSSWVDLGKSLEFVQYLPRGKYKLYYHASKVFEPKAKPSHYITIIIKTPFYLTSWAFWAEGILLSIGVIILFNQYKNFQFEKSRSAWLAKEALLKERNRMAKELHDFIGAHLSIISRNIFWLLENKNKLPVKSFDQKLDQIGALATQTNADLRDTIWASKKESLTSDELIDRIKTYSFAIFKDNFVVKINNLLVQPEILSANEALSLLRITQESIINAVKYARIEEIVITISKNEISDFLLEITDNGIGFDLNNSNNGNGLTNMKERAQEINFTCSISSEQGKGCTILLVKNG